MRLVVRYDPRGERRRVLPDRVRVLWLQRRDLPLVSSTFPFTIVYGGRDDALREYTPSFNVRVLLHFITFYFYALAILHLYL